MALLLLAIAGFAFRPNATTPESIGPESTARRLLFLGVPPTLYFLVSLTSKMNLGVRHVLPMFPFLIALVAAGTWRLWRRSRAWAVVVGLLVAFHIFSSLHSFPDYLPYSNELFGGKEKTYRLLNTSNADWGQGLKQTVRYLQDHNVGDCWLAYFGTGTPAAYGIHCKPLPGFFNLVAAQFLAGGGCAAKDPDLQGTLIIGANVPTGSINGPLDLVGIELGRANGEVEGYHPRPFGCEVGSQFHQRDVSRGPPTIPEGRISRFRFSPWLSPKGLSEMHVV